MSKEVVDRLERVARGRFTLLLLAMFAFILVYPLMVEEGLRGQWIAGLFFLAIILSSLRAVYRSRSPRYMWSLYAAALAALAMDGLYILFPESAAMAVLRSTAHVAVFSVVAGLILIYVLGHGDITFDRIAAAVCVYLFIGIIWTDIFQAIETVRPGALSIAPGYGDTPSSPYLYFSFVTLTTLGYGDVSPVHALARAFAYVEAMVGQLFLAILIGRLVGAFVGRRNPGPDRAG